MKNSDLNSLLRSARIPEHEDSFWAGFAPAVIRRIREEPEPSSIVRPWPTLVAVGFVAAVLGVGLGFFLWYKTSSSRDPFVQLSDGRALRDVLRHYPTRLEAIVRDEQGLHVILSDKSDVPASMPIWIEINGNGYRRAVVTFSGQRVILGGEWVEVLADPSGKVMLIGDRLFWSPDIRTGAATSFDVRVRSTVGNL